MEATLVPKHGYEMRLDPLLRPARQRASCALALLPLNLLVAFWQSARAIFRVRPDVVLGMGGYVSFPGGMMASLLNRPLVLHEQNSIAGLANRVLAQRGRPHSDRLSRACCKKAQWVGNPVRTAIAQLPPPAAALRRPQRTAAAAGGRRQPGRAGAERSGAAGAGAAARRSDARRSRIRPARSISRRCAQLSRRPACRPNAVAFIDDMAAHYAEADLVICRAGALTVSELAAAGVASVLVPFPLRGRRPSDAQRALSRRRGRGGADPAARACRRAGSPICCSSFTREQVAGDGRRARALAKPDATGTVAGVCMAAAG